MDYPITGGIVSPSVVTGKPIISFAIRGAITSPSSLGLVDLMVAYVFASKGIVRPATYGGSVAVALDVVGAISAPAVVAGRPAFALHFNFGISSSHIMAGAFHTPVVLTGGVLSAGMLDGVFIINRSSVVAKEAAYEKTGYRSMFGVIVYAVNCETTTDIAEVPDNGAFIVSAAFMKGPGDPFYDAGAAANSIGFKILDEKGARYLIFRQPAPNETVWMVQ